MQAQGSSLATHTRSGKQRRFSNTTNEILRKGLSFCPHSEAPVLELQKSIVSGSCGCSQPERPGGFKSVLHDGHGVGEPQDAVSRTSRNENTPDDAWKAVIRRDMIDWKLASRMRQDYRDCFFGLYD